MIVHFHMNPSVGKEASKRRSGLIKRNSLYGSVPIDVFKRQELLIFLQLRNPWTPPLKSAQT